MHVEKLFCMRKFCVLLAFLCVNLFVLGQGYSNKGKDFWIPYPEHIDGTNSAMGLYITSDVAATGTISVGSTSTINFTVAPNAVVYKFLGPNGGGDAPNTGVYLGGLQDNVVSNKGIHVVSSMPVVVFAHIIRSARSGASLVLPTKVWGKEYVLPSYNNTGNSQGYGELVVFASKPNTTIEITPSISSRNGLHPANVPFQVTLPNIGDIYQLQFVLNGDASGTKIKSLPSPTGGCNPISVFSATTWSGIGCSGASGGDNFLQQLFPTDSWGKQYVTGPLKKVATNPSDNNVDIIRVFVSDPTAIVSRTDNGTTTTLTGLVNNSYYEYTTSRPNMIVSDKPIQVVQYIRSQNCGSPQTSSDPEMIALSSIEQTINDITVFSAHQSYVPPGQSQVTAHYLNVIMKTSNTSLFRINGLLPTSTFTPIPATDYSYLKEDVSIRAATNPVFRLSADSGFSAIAYGFGNVESYGYNAGTNVVDLYNNANLYVPFSTIPNQLITCVNTDFKYKISFPYQPISLLWDFHGDPLHPNVTQPAPLAYDSVVVVNGQNIYWYSLPGFYNYTIPGTYQVSVIAQTGGVGGCGSEAVKDFEITIVNRPQAGYNFNAPACFAEIVNFTNTSTTTHPFYQWNWNFGDPSSGTANTSGVSNPSHQFTAPGTYSVNYWALNEIGCRTDTLIQQVVVPQNPTATISGAANVCINSTSPTVTLTGAGGVLPYTFTYSNNGGAPQTISTTGTNTTATISIPTTTPSNQLFQLLTVSTGTNSACIVNATPTDTVRVIVRDLTTANITGGTNVCQNATSPQVTFTANGGIAPYTFTYNINGGSAQTVSATTGNTATVNVPTSTPGTFVYNITNVADGGGNCVQTPSGSTTFIVNPNPAAAIAGTANLCVGDAAATVTFTGSSATSPYTFTYSVNGGAPQTISSVAPSNTATIIVPTTTSLNNVYALQSVTSGTNPACSMAASGNVTVIVRDVTTGTISGGATVCQGDPTPQVTFTGAVGPQPYTFTYNINGGAAQTVTTTTGASVSLNVPTNTNGTFTYNITNVADAGGVNCIQTPTGSATFIVQATPVISFTATPTPPATALCNNRTITFTPVTSIAAGNVSTWGWDFGDGNTAQYTNGNPFSYTYATPGTKTVTVTATSDLGCTKTFTQNITINTRPSAGFINPNVCLADLAGANFIDTSHANGGTIIAWNWNFGDPSSPGNTSTQQNPSHYYSTTGVKDVTLIVTNQGGCTDTLQQLITINGSIPVASFTVQNQGALCSNNTVSIVNTSTVDVGNVIKNEIYWDFVNNPTVFDTHPFPTNGQVFTHNYPVSNIDRAYRVRYRAFSGITCIDEKFIDITVHAKPDPVFAAVAPVCLNNGTIQLTQGSEANGIPGSGIYTGTGVSAAGVFDPLTAGVGVHTLTWVYTTTFGCKDSTTRDVTVLQAPVSGFNVSNLKCERSDITFTPTATSSVGTITQWIWNFGDSPTNQTTTNNSPVTHVYQSTGNYTVTLVVVTSDGCRSTPFTQTIFVNPTPVPQFTFTASACLPQAKIDFTNTTPGLVNYTYSWEFGDPSSPTNTSNTTHSSHTYTAVGPYTVLLTATSPTSGCTHDTSIIVNSIHRQPIASFRLSAPAVCIDKPLTVTDNSIPVEGSIASWNWEYGDNTSATGQSPAAHLYTAQGTYQVKLTVTSSFGCTDDSTISFRVWNYPDANAGPTLYILEGGSQTILATASGQSLSYVWTTIPSGFTSTLNSTSILQPIVSPIQDMRYLLTVSNPANCIDTSSVFVKVLRQPDIPNTFSPNNDGINDYWLIDYLSTYPQCKVQVFTRTGQKVFESRGYKEPWDGNMNGKSLPMDTYYYIIEPGNGRTPLKGYVQIIK